MTKRMHILMTNLVMLNLLAVAAAQSPDAPERSTSSPSSDAIEAVLRRSALKPPAIPPAGRGKATVHGGGGDRRFVATAGLLPEGTTVALRTGRLENRAGEDFFVFTDAAPSSTAMPEIRVLFNARLRQMQNYVQAAQRDLEFRVIGEVTEYHNSNYLLVRELHVVKRAARSGGGPANPGSGDVIDDIVRDMGGAATIPEPSALMSTSTDSVETTGMAKWAEDTRQISRIGRLVRQANGWAFMFESASEQPADPAVDLLPNLALQAMEERMAGGPHGVVFVVSGDITEYGGRNYMLVRRFALRSPDGNVP